PFTFATNGRPTLKQVKTKRGVWFRDLRLDTNLTKPLVGWWTPEGLKAARGGVARVGPKPPALLGGWA
ncbi:MAG: hypothetical protein IPI35_25475, partial [Deltaproteobacteria bacterium]|nr:hypothetical protein [Deltaproteobacteria bacterium]